jgi:1,4-alpha-glucan branching enzyme
MSPSDLERLAAREHADPHAVLGAHPDAGGVVVRALRPGASSVTLRAGGTEVALALEHDAGVFAGAVPGAELPLDYELEVAYPDGEGRHEELYARLGAHVREIDGVRGTAFAVWAPAARAVSVAGDFNLWDARVHPMRSLGSSGIWELFVPGAGDGARYKFEVRGADGSLALKADPFAFAAEVPPQTSSVVHARAYEWTDAAWLAARAAGSPLERPVSVYEVHLGSWRRNPLEGDRPLTYLELADELAAYVTDLGFTHVELLPVMAHPFSGSWGYQVTSYFAPTPHFGSPDDFRAFVDRLHAAGVGVILDWVPAHFPRDDWALARFDGTALYEHEDPRRGAHPDWGTLVFNYGRNEVRNFLVSNALFWAREYHADGIRVDAVASMLYLDYSREAGEWVPNEHGGREDLEAVAFLQELNEVLHAREPGVISSAEESTAWPGVSRPTYLGGLGFGFKWNMGWMHDTLGYFQQDPIHRRYHHHQLTFSLMYAFSENFVLPLSHDEVVHGKGSLVGKMPGDAWQQHANLRALYAYMWAHPGKKLLFMGQEFAQEQEWSHERSLDWHLLEQPEKAGLQALVRALNGAYRSTPALWEVDFSDAGFFWIEANAADDNVVIFARAGRDPATDVLVCACNLAPVPREGYRVGLPAVPGGGGAGARRAAGGRWRELLNTDAGEFGGTGSSNPGPIEPDPIAWHGQPLSAEITLPPLHGSTSGTAKGTPRSTRPRRASPGRSAP